MKKLYLIAICILLSCVLYAQNFSFDGKYYPDLYSTVDYLIFNGNSISYKYESYEPKDAKEEISVACKKIYKDGLLFLQMSKRFPYSITECRKDVPASDCLLVLAGKSMFSHGYEVLLFVETSDFNDPYPFICPSIKFVDLVLREYEDCSSYLVEGDREYKVENLCNCKMATPWVEGAPGSGIGEGFTIKKQNYSQAVPSCLLIMNGYISCEKPYLYKQNNRIKKIKVTGVKSGKSKILDVLDTPHPQTVDISFITEPEDIRVEIADVYRGTKYDDTCINFCVTYHNKVIPYESSVR